MENIYEDIEALALTAMIAESTEIFKRKPPLDEAAAKISLIPISLASYVSEQNLSSAHTHFIPNAQQANRGAAYILRIICPKRPSNWLKITTTTSYALNPIGKAVRDSLRDLLFPPPEVEKLIPVFRKFGLDITLGVFDELINQGVPPSTIKRNIHEYCHKKLDVEIHELTELKNEYIDLGVISGACDAKPAKIGERLGSIGGAIAGAKAGAMIGSIIPGPGTAVGAAIGATFGQLFGKTFGNGLGQSMLASAASKKEPSPSSDIAP